MQSVSPVRRGRNRWFLCVLLLWQIISSETPRCSVLVFRRASSFSIFVRTYEPVSSACHHLTLDSKGPYTLCCARFRHEILENGRLVCYVRSHVDIQCCWAYSGVNLGGVSFTEGTIDSASNTIAVHIIIKSKLARSSRSYQNYIYIFASS